MNRFLSVLGALVLVVASAAPAFADTGGGEADLGLDAIAIAATTVHRDGSVTVTGTIECSQDVAGQLNVSLRQDVGRFFSVAGGGWGGFTCLAADGSATFTSVVEPYGGKFGGGRATVYAHAYALLCEPTDEEYEPNCSYDWTSYGPSTVRLGR